MLRIAVSILAAIAGFALAKATNGIRRNTVTTAPPLREEVQTTAPKPNPAQLDKTPLGVAMQTVAAIDAMTLADFQAIANDPSKFPKPDKQISEWALGYSYVDALVARWLTVDPVGGLTAIQQTEKALRPADSVLNRTAMHLRQALARHRPVEFLAGLPEKLEQGQAWNEVRPAIISLAKRDIHAARAAVERFSDKQVRESAELALAEGLAENDPVAAAALARQLGRAEILNLALVAASKSGRETMRQVIAAGGEKLRPNGNFSELMMRYPDEDWQSMVSDFPYADGNLDYPRIIEAMRMSREKRTNVLEQLERFPKNGGKKVADSLMRAWMLESPAEALDWAAGKANGTTDERLQAAFDLWASDDREAARSWLSRLPESKQRTELGNRFAATLAIEGDLDAAMRYFVPSAGKDSDEAVREIASTKTRTDPAAAAAWLANLPPEAGAGAVNAAESVVGPWFEKAPSEVAKWIETLPSGALRDKALYAFTYRARDADPFVSAEWLALIEDPKAKTEMAMFVFQDMRRNDPAAARAWIQNLKGVDPVWREQFLRVKP